MGATGLIFSCRTLWVCHSNPEVSPSRLTASALCTQQPRELALGQTRLKHRQLRHLGMSVVSVSVAEWEYLESAEEKVEYLREKMATPAA